jgi:hypothetical protein
MGLIESTQYSQWGVNMELLDRLGTTPGRSVYFCRYTCFTANNEVYINRRYLPIDCRKCLWTDKPVCLVDGDRTNDTLYTSTVKDIATVDEQLIVLHNNGLLTRDGHFMDEWFLSYIVE